MLPVENISPHHVPRHPVCKANGLRGGEKHLRHHHLRRLSVVTANLVHSQRDRLVLACVLALNDQNRNAINQEHHILACAMFAVVRVKLLRHLIHIAPLLTRAGEVVVINQHQVKFAVLLRIEKLMLIPKRLKEIPVAIDVGVKALKFADQRALGLLVFGIKSKDLGVQKIAEVDRRFVRPLFRLRTIRVKAAPSFSFIAWHVRPANLLRVVQDAGLDGFVFARRWHGSDVRRW